ncbi:MAG TPA: isoamylase early set domain-containing protein [Calditrichia bacterium]|nr:isoamylase early set domain-containing protein [Calditrichia bacterium]
MASNNPRNISRVENDKTQGWFVRMRLDGKGYAKMFSDKKYGGKKKAKAVALDHRDMLLEQKVAEKTAKKAEKTAKKADEKKATPAKAPARRGRPAKKVTEVEKTIKKVAKTKAEAPQTRRRGRPRKTGEDSEEMRGISRIDSANTHGWFVRVYRNKKTHSKLFSDKKYGDNKGALQEAIAYRDQLVTDLESGKVPTGKARRGRPAKKASAAKPAKSTAKKSTSPQVASLDRRLVQSRNVYKVTFFLPAAAAPQAKTVNLVGDFNNWNKTADRMKKSRDGSFSIKMEIPAGKDYQFRYLIDGVTWENDWQADRYEFNGIDGDNSVLSLS